VIQLLHEDDHLLVVCKPHGLPSQNTRRGEPNLYDRLRATYPGLALLHRLDQPTSGVMVFGRSPVANRALTEAFRSHNIQRTYVAVAAGKPPASTFRIDDPIDDRPAATQVHVLHAQRGLACVALSPETGRTHQLRKHLLARRLPIVGDRRYGGQVGAWAPRLMLHAATLHLDHPATGEPMHWFAPLPTDFVGFWKQAGGPANLSDALAAVETPVR